MKKTSAPAVHPAQTLYSANLAYCQRLAALAQESQQRWLALARQVWGDGSAQFQTTFAPLSQTQNWQDLAPAIGEVARKQWQQRLSAAEALVHTALEEQATFASEMSDATRTWMHDSAGACTGLSDSPIGRMWTTLSEQVAHAVTSSQSGGTSHGR